MADTSNLSLNWKEIDNSLLRTIEEMRAARDYFRKNSPAFESLWPNAAYSPGGSALTHASVLRDVHVGHCFDDAERMLAQARTMMMVARSMLSGASSRLALPTEMAAGPSDAPAAAGPPPMVVGDIFGAVSIVLSPLKRAVGSVAARVFRTIRTWLPSANSAIVSAAAPAEAARDSFARYLGHANFRNQQFRARRRLRYGSYRLAQAARDVSRSSMNWRFGGLIDARVVAILCIAASVSAGAAWAIRATPALLASTHISAIAPRVAPAKMACAVQSWGQACYPRHAPPTE